MKKWALTTIAIVFSGLILWSCSDDDGGTEPEPENIAPTFTITSPLPYTAFNSGEVIEVKVTAEDSDGDIKEVRFYLNGEGEDSENSFPFNGEISTTALISGGHIIKVEVEDDDGAVAEAELHFGIKPQNPTNLQINQNNVYTFTLNWDYGFVGADGFKIERKIDDGVFSEIATTTATSYIDSTLSKKGYESVYYQVKAFKDVYSSDYASNSYSISFPAPYNLTYSKINLSTIQLNWLEDCNGEDGFKIDKKVGVAEWITAYANVGENIRTWSDTSAEINEDLQYRVYAYKGINTSSSIETAAIVNTFPAPTGLTSTQVNLTTATIAWTDNSKGEEKFEIERKLSSETTYIKIGEVTGSDTSTKSYSDTSVEPAKIYDYRVRATKSTDTSAYVTKTGFNNTFTAPSNLSIVQNNVYTFTLNWTDNSTGEDGFKIERKIDDGTYTEIASVTNTSYTDNTVSKGFGVVYYRVRAYKATYYSNYASQSSVVTFPAPTNLTYSKVTLNTVKLDWLETSNGEDGFKIDKKIGTEEWTIAYGTVGSNIKTWSDSNADINELLQYRVYAFKGSNISEFATSELIDNTFPSPSNINIEQTTLTNATISWDDNSIGEDRFDIERKLSNESTYIKIIEVTGNDTSTKTWIDSSTVPNLIYDYRVKAVKSSYSSVYVQNSYNNTFPAPTNLTVTQDNVSTFTLNWTDNSIGEDGFKIERKIDDGTFIEIASITGTSYTDDTVSKKGYGTVYYQVRAYRNTYYSVYIANSSPVSFSAPTNLTYTKINLSTIKLDWQEISSGEEGFKIDKKVGTAEWVTDYAFVGENVKTWTDTNAEINENLQYRIYAYKGVNTSSSIESATIDNTFPAPTNLTATQNNLTSVIISWSDNSLGEDKFEIERKLSTDTIFVKVTEISGSDTSTKNWTDTSLIPNLIYNYRLKSVKDGYSSAYIQQTFVNTFSPPINLSTSHLNLTTANLQWYDRSKGEEKFDIERKLSTDSVYIKIGEKAGNDDVTPQILEYLDMTLVTGLVYDYRVKAVYDIYSTSYISSNDYISFPPPTDLTTTCISDTSLELNWTDNSNGEQGFKIDRKVGSTGSWVTDYATTEENVATWTETGLLIGQTYYYRVRAYYSIDTTDYSNEVSETLWDISRFVLIPTGSFIMGQEFVATPEHQVNITRPFYLGKYEITQDEWINIMGSNPSYYTGDLNMPVGKVNWYTALVYCNKRSMAEGLGSCYTINGSSNPDDWGSIPTAINATWDAVICDFNAKGFRIPTEAEWEYAAQYNDDRKYPWGNTTPNSTLANYHDYVGTPTVVGSYPLGNTNLGISDMAGNIYEWVWDWFVDYSSSTQTNPTGPISGTYHILRGGSFGTDSYISGLSCAARTMHEAFKEYRDGGLRLAKTK